MSDGETMDSLLRLDSGGWVELFMSKVEIGQGIQTAVAQIAAEELDVDIERIRVVAADTAVSADASYTAGSNSIQTLGNAVRSAAADARHHLLQLASARFETPVAELVVEDGTISAPTGKVAYWDLLGGRTLDCAVTGAGTPKSPDSYKVVGRSAPRPDLPDKVTGEPCFVHDLQLADMVHGRVVRPPTYTARLHQVDGEAVSAMPGVLRLVRDGSFLGVIAEREEQAVAASQALAVAATWTSGEPLPSPDTLFEDLRSAEGEDFLVIDGAPVDGPVPPIAEPEGAARTLKATYERPFQMHAALGPSAAAAVLDDGYLSVWSQTQGVFPLRGSLASALGMPLKSVRVRHVEGSGCYGHNGADDAALDAALLAQAIPGRPVMLKWQREDEHCWEAYGSAMIVDMQASLASDGRVIDWNHDVWSYTHSSRPRPMEGTSNLLAAWHRAEPLPKPAARPGGGHHGGIHRNADPLYDFPRRRIVKHFAGESPLRVSALRGLGSFGNVFAIESFMDELALAAGSDPLDFRLQHLKDERAREVLEAAARRAQWESGPKKGGSGDGRGRGMAFAQYKNAKCYVAVVVDLSADTTSGQIRLERIVVGADVGQVVNPDGVANQLEGGVLQAASWTLKEEVRYGPDGIASRDWDTYPILRFSEIPEVETVILDRPGLPSLGCGEATMGPTPAAIANALFVATGVRLRRVPFDGALRGRPSILGV